ncbi:Gustatory receptor 23 [Hyalella azteca]|uniref:Gustatory receptor 23 n=2 Tax=Hyalella azteca TaxID=294128 RepID=A0A6A0HFN6_HYAAZ|nr:Gustatory receptor 23 [Hyalella azteca]
MNQDSTKTHLRIPFLSVVVFWLKVLRAFGCFPYSINLIEIDEETKPEHKIRWHEKIDDCYHDQIIGVTPVQVVPPAGKGKMLKIEITSFKHRWSNTCLLIGLTSFTILASFAEFKIQQEFLAVQMTSTEKTTAIIISIFGNFLYMCVTLHTWWNSSTLQNLVRITMEVLEEEKEHRNLQSVGNITLLFFPLLIVELVVLGYTQFKVGRELLREQMWESFAPIVWATGLLQLLINYSVYFSLVCINIVCQSCLVFSFENISRSLERKLEVLSRKRVGLVEKVYPQNNRNSHALAPHKRPRNISKLNTDHSSAFLKPELFNISLYSKENILAPRHWPAGQIQSTCSSTDGYSEIDLTQLLRLSMIQDEINNFFWFCTLIYSAAFVLFSAGVGFLSVMSGLTVNQSWSFVLYFVILLMPLGLLYHTADQLHDRKNRVIQKLAHLQLIAADPSEADQARRQLEFVRIQPGATAGSFFALSKAKLLGMIGFVGTYLVILLQFNGKATFLKDRFLNNTALQYGQLEDHN